DRCVTVAWVHAATREHIHPGRERHRRLPAHQVRLHPVRAVPEHDDGGRVPRWCRGGDRPVRQMVTQTRRDGVPDPHLSGVPAATSTIISTSTGPSSGSTGTPTALRACCPASANTVPISSLAPFATLGCAVKSVVLATNATTLTTRTTLDSS